MIAPGPVDSLPVDWADVERRGRRRYLLRFPALAAFLLAWAVLHQRPGSPGAALAWWFTGASRSVP